jgi:hypothetical protein
MSYSHRARRHRNPKREESKSGDSFFTHANPGTVQTKRETPFFQAKLTIGEPNDQYEQEADAVASRVADQSQGGTEGGPGPVQRKKINQVQRLSSSKEEEKLGTNEERMRRDKEIQTKPEIQKEHAPDEKQEKEKVQMKTQEEERDEMKSGAMAQRKPETGASAAASPALSSHIEQSAGKGRTLPGKTLDQMQGSLGYDFSQVNIHTGQDSVTMNKELGAQAFTHGKDIFFNKGKYDPDSTEGKRLLAHELTHVVQQGSAENESRQ